MKNFKLINNNEMIMKSFYKLLKIDMFIVIVLAIYLIITLFFLTSCDNNDGVNDVIAPAIKITAVEQNGDTLLVDYNESGSFFEIQLSDANLLKSNNVKIYDSEGKEVYNITKQLNRKQQHDTVYMSELRINTPYNVKVETSDINNNISSIEFTALVSIIIIYPHVGLVGSATSIGWDLGNRLAMDSISPNYFRWEGTLGAGELKFPLFQGSDWCGGDWINSATAEQSINNSEFIITHGCDGPDNKWVITEETAGNYEINLNTKEKKLTITKQ